MVEPSVTRTNWSSVASARSWSLSRRSHTEPSSFGGPPTNRIMSVARAMTGLLDRGRHLRPAHRDPTESLPGRRAGSSDGSGHGAHTRERGAVTPANHAEDVTGGLDRVG